MYFWIQSNTIGYMKKCDDNPTAIRLGQLKAPLQKEAMKQDRSLHWLVIKFLKECIKKYNIQ